MTDFFKDNKSYIRINTLDLDKILSFKKIKPNSDDLSSIKKFIHFASNLQDEYKKYYKNNENHKIDNLFKKELNIVILNLAKDIKVTKERKVFWINNNVYILENNIMFIGSNRVNILYCNEDGFYTSSLNTDVMSYKNIFLSFVLNFNFFDFDKKNIRLIDKTKIKNTTLTIIESSDNKKIIVEQYDEDRVRVASSEIIRNEIKNFKRVF